MDKLPLLPRNFCSFKQIGDGKWVAQGQTVRFDARSAWPSPQLYPIKKSKMLARYRENAGHATRCDLAACNGDSPGMRGAEAGSLASASVRITQRWMTSAIVLWPFWKHHGQKLTRLQPIVLENHARKGICTQVTFLALIVHSSL